MMMKVFTAVKREIRILFKDIIDHVISFKEKLHVHSNSRKVFQKLGLAVL